MSELRTYQPRGLAAVDTSAIGQPLSLAPHGEAFELRGDVAIVRVCGPICKGEEGCESYESILCHVTEALASSAKTVLLAIDSPGGDADGCLEMPRTIRARAQATNKRVVAYSSGMIASAAQALSCAADVLLVRPSSYVGSVGVITVLAEQSALDAAMGLKFSVLTSGARKSDGFPHVPITDGALSAYQSRTDALAAMFFGLVGETRGLSPETVKGFEAALFTGVEAVGVGLATALVNDLDEALAFCAGSNEAPIGAKGTGAMAKSFDEMRAEMDEMAAGEGPEADKMRAALAKMDAEEGEKKDPPDEEPKAEENEEEPKEDPLKKATEKKEEAKVNAKTAKAGVDLVAAVVELNAKFDNLERDKLLATRPDLMAHPATKAWLSQAPLATVKNAVKSIAKPKTSTTAATGAELERAPTTGAKSGEAAQSSPELAAHIKSRMMPAREKGDVKWSPTETNTRVFRPMTPAEAKNFLAKKEGN